jgi:uncharacterized RDD family membrane protein YckC
VHSSEQLRVDTPEQIALEFPLAGIGSRFLAVAIDTLLQIAVFIVLAAGTFFASSVIARVLPMLGAWLTFAPAVMIFLIFCLYWGYFAGFEILWKGQTPGKRVAGIRVIRESGRPIDASAAILRNLVRIIDFLPGMYGIGVTCMLLNRQSRRLGDFVAGTVVVHDRQPEDARSAWSPSKPEGAAVAGGANPMPIRISDAELVLIEAYLERRSGLDWQARDRTATMIVRRISEKTGTKPEPGQTEDEFLETVARRARDGARFR